MLHSATCGDDFIHIHKKYGCLQLHSILIRISTVMFDSNDRKKFRLKRPIYVSVFGHPSFEISIFYLKIVARDSTEEDLIDFQLLDLKSEQSFEVDVPSVRSNYIVTR